MGTRAKIDPRNDNLKHLQRKTCVVVADCEDCGKRNVRNRRVCYQLTQIPYKHWRTRCSCGTYYNPLTDSWENVTGLELTADMRQLYSKIKG